MFGRKNVCIRRNLPGGVMSILFAHQRNYLNAARKQDKAPDQNFKRSASPDQTVLRVYNSDKRKNDVFLMYPMHAAQTD